MVAVLVGEHVGVDEEPALRRRTATSAGRRSSGRCRRAGRRGSRRAPSRWTPRRSWSAPEPEKNTVSVGGVPAAERLASSSPGWSRCRRRPRTPRSRSRRRRCPGTPGELAVVRLLALPEAAQPAEAAPSRSPPPPPSTWSRTTTSRPTRPSPPPPTAMPAAAAQPAAARRDGPGCCRGRCPALAIPHPRKTSCVGLGHREAHLHRAVHLLPGRHEVQVRFALEPCHRGHRPRDSEPAAARAGVPHLDQRGQLRRRRPRRTAGPA